MANRNPVCDRIFSSGGVFCASEAETRALGYGLAAEAGGALVISLEGTLGAGKTCFVKGLAEGLGIDPEGVSSPTFTLVHEYLGGRIPLVHFDLYRLDSESELPGLGFDDYLVEPGIIAIEWGDKFPGALPADVLKIRFVIEGGGRRLQGEIPP